MRFNPKARLDRSRMGDAGRGGGGGGYGGGGQTRIPLPGGVKAGGGIGTTIIIVLYVVLTQCVGDQGGVLPNDSLDTGRFSGADSGRYDSCQTGQDANEDADCARVAVENSLTDFWSKALPAQSSTSFTPEKSIETFTGSINTGCGQATAD